MTLRHNVILRTLGTTDGKQRENDQKLQQGQVASAQDPFFYQIRVDSPALCPLFCAINHSIATFYAINH